MCCFHVRTGKLTRVFTSFRIKTVVFRMISICDVVFGSSIECVTDGIEILFWKTPVAVNDVDT